MCLVQDYFLNRMDNNEICKLRDPFEVAANARERKIPTLTGIDLIKMNVESEANKLGMHIMHMDLTRSMKNKIVNHIWSNLTSAQRKEFTSLANKINDINQNAAKASEDFIKRMIQNDAEQVINSPFESSIFVGTKFSDENYNE